MKFHKGFYSLIQYCPDPARCEAANVGVLLFCPEVGFLSAKMSQDNRRVQQFFGREGHDWQQVKLFKDGMQTRIEKEAARIKSPEQLQKFVDSRANLIRVTDPIPMRVIDPESDLLKLFQSLVSEEVSAPTTPRRRFQSVVADRFRAAKLGKKLHEPGPISVPFLKKPVQFPFGFQNGRFNLIQPISFVTEDPDDAVSKAWRWAAEGQCLYENPHEKLGELKLIVVGEFRSKSDESRASIAPLLERHQVKLVPNDQLDSLVQEISVHGKEIELAICEKRQSP